MEMTLSFGDVQETALIPLAIKASETSRENARIRDEKAQAIIEKLTTHFHMNLSKTYLLI